MGARRLEPRAGRTPFGKGIGAVALGLLMWQLILPAPAYAAGGTLDRSFSGDGRVRSVQRLGDVTDLVVDARDRIVLADDSFGLARLKVNGALDTTFGNHGVVSTRFPGWATQKATDLARGPGGSLVVAGFVRSRNGLNDELAIARFTPSGHPDSTFGDGGRVLLTCPPRPFCEGSSVAVQSDGKVVVAASSAPFVFRLKSNGRPDPTFSRDGHIILRLGPNSGLGDVSMEADGTILVAGSVIQHGSSHVEVLLARLRPGAPLDPSFGTKGIARLPRSFGGAEAVQIMDDGRIVVAGETSSCCHWLVARFDPDGHLDRSFSTAGTLTVRLDCQDVVRGVAIDGGGRIVVVGGTFDCSGSGDFRPVIVRLTPGGTLDRSFSGDGKIIWKAFGFATAVAIQHLATDRIVVGGQGPTEVRGRGPFVVARYLD